MKLCQRCFRVKEDATLRPRVWSNTLQTYDPEIICNSCATKWAEPVSFKAIVRDVNTYGKTIMIKEGAD